MELQTCNGSEQSFTVNTTTDYIRAKTNFNLSPIYSAHKSPNHKSSTTGEKKTQKHKSSPDTNLHKQNIHKHNIFEEL